VVEWHSGIEIDGLTQRSACPHPVMSSNFPIISDTEKLNTKWGS